MDYNETIKVIDELEILDELITPPKYRRCCYNTLEICKIFVNYVKNIKNLNKLNE